ncbi:MAG: Gfo/Idh/MocA family oxidoreductase [Solirubrobacterales bacterium]
MSGNGPLRWGILSTAQIIDELLPGYAAAADARLDAVASRDGERAARYASEHGIGRSFGSYQELLADEEIDCVYIPLPNALHGEWTRAALESGKHVLCEKPLTPTAAEAASLFDLAEERGLVLMEAFMYRHHPKTKTLGELVRGGRIGQPRVVRMRFHFRVEDPATDIRYSAPLAGGALRDVGCYCVSMAGYLLGGAPDEVSATARGTASGVDETFAATMRFGDDAVAVFDCGMQTPLDVGVEVLGTEGRAVVRMPWYPHLEPLSIELETGGEVEEVPTPGGNAYQLEIENFCAAVRGEAATEVSREETLRNLETIERLLAVRSLEPEDQP